MTNKEFLEITKLLQALQDKIHQTIGETRCCLEDIYDHKRNDLNSKVNKIFLALEWFEPNNRN